MPSESDIADETAGLPPALAERCRCLNTTAVRCEGEFVLYWMHHAVRGHENPALDVARCFAHDQGLPVLVYQGLGGGHRFNSDRHHTFILQGARDAHRELHARGITAVFHLDPSGANPSPLRDLARRCALMVVEDFPAPPLNRWTMNLADQAAVRTFAVDCACIVPMQQQPAISHAYAFRQANKAEYERRVSVAWHEIDVDLPRFSGDLGFDAIDLERMDVAKLCAACEIDHSIPPVAHTAGGSTAGYARWRQFLQKGLDTYAAERNDAAVVWPRGVSRLSPYLHHGHVSPFRVAREAAARGGPGADKFLDELLIWRELAHNLCFHNPNPERIDVLPDWAQQTLAAHAADTRPHLYDSEALARSQTDDALWNLAQASLRIHGELHNNLRMTWAKAILQWRPSPQSALDTLLELNHRYALDGSDPNSYGGLLWAMGMFDRPFQELPVIGRLRGRSTRSHAERLDVDRYARRVLRPAGGKALRVGVIGAGIAGLAAARVLHDQGHRVVVFEKSRGLGGRAATRRVGGIGFDHGAQYFTADQPLFERAVRAWQESGVIQRWRPRLGRVNGKGIQASPDNRERYVAVPGMSALGRHLAAGLEIHRELRVAPLRRTATSWRLQSEDGTELDDFDAVIVAVPAPQAAELLRSSAPTLADRAARVEYAPTWAVMADTALHELVAYDGLFFESGALSWAAHNGSKAERLGRTWVLHASSQWTRDRLDETVEAVGAALTAEFCAALDIDPGLLIPRSSHRWLYSRVEHPLRVGALWDAELGLAVCGDWCQGGKIEGAYLSGQAAAGHLLRGLALEGTAEQQSAGRSAQGYVFGQ